MWTFMGPWGPGSSVASSSEVDAGRFACLHLKTEDYMGVGAGGSEVGGGLSLWTGAGAAALPTLVLIECV